MIEWMYSPYGLGDPHPVIVRRPPKKKKDKK